jgi:predicted phage terminase large subunit-like protein
MCRHPTLDLIATSHTDSLAETFSRRVRDDITEHGPYLGIRLDKASSAAARWSLTTRGSYTAAGAGQAILGRRADLVIVDDPIASAEKAYSEGEREKLWLWFTTELMTRMKPQAPILVIGTFWHLDDLFGRIIERARLGTEEWTIIRIPAESLGPEIDPLGRPAGEFLWSRDPNHDYAGWLRQQKQTQSPRDWAAMFQADPIAIGAGMFTEEMFKFSEMMPDPKDLHIYIGCDFATRAGSGDFTAFVVVGVDSRGSWYLLSVYRRQKTPDVWSNALADLIIRYRPVHAVAVEGGQIWNTVEPMLRSTLRRRQVMPLFRKFTRTKDKPTTALTLQGILADRPMSLPKGTTWANEFLSEMLTFPAAGRGHDDQCDALATLAMMAPKMSPKVVEEIPKNPRLILKPGEIWLHDPLLDLPDGPGKRPNPRIY